MKQILFFFKLLNLISDFNFFSPGNYYLKNKFSSIILVAALPFSPSSLKACATFSQPYPEPHWGLTTSLKDLEKNKSQSLNLGIHRHSFSPCAPLGVSLTEGIGQGVELFSFFKRFDLCQQIPFLFSFQEKLELSSRDLGFWKTKARKPQRLFYVLFFFISSL